MGFIQKLEDVVGAGNFSASPVDCLAYSRDMSIHAGIPHVIVFAVSTEQVSQIMALANSEKVPVVARGTGSSVTGAVLPVKGGIVLDFTKMTAIKDISKADGYAIIEPGVICNALNARLAPTHFFPPDPGSAAIATVGGMIATNASGVRAAKYGTTKDYVKALTVVLADGRIIRTGDIAPKSSAGYDLTHLFSSSEGTLGIITEAVVKILPMPEYEAFAQVSFPDVPTAGKAVEKIFTSGLELATCEILDNVCLDVARDALKMDIPKEVNCQLFMGIDGPKSAVREQIEKIDEICSSVGGLNSIWSDNPVEKAKLFAARGGLVPAMSRLQPGYRLVPLVEDFGVPISKIPGTIAEIQAIGSKYGFPVATFGHIGDGNLHATFIMNPTVTEQWDKVKSIALEFIDMTLKYQGTVSAEHGIGMAKSPYIGRQLGEALNVMKDIKKALDPNNILNPGKMGFDDAIGDILDENTFQKYITRPDKVEHFPEGVDNEILACIQCGFCRAGCPTFGESTLESLNAKGRVTLAFNMLLGDLQPSEDLAKRLYQCMMCLNCKSVCPAQVDVSAIVRSARERLVDMGYLPEVFKPALASMIDAANPLLAAPEKRADSYPAGYKKAVPGETESVLHMGCVTSFQDIKIIPALVQILDSAGVNYGALSEDETCCGYLAYLVGDTQTFKRVREMYMDRMAVYKPKQLITSCAGCLKTFRDLYPQYGGDNGFAVLHVVELMEKLIAEGKLTFRDDAKELQVVYHDPCDMGRHMGVYEPPRNVIKGLPGVELLEFPLNRAQAKCCGGGGGMKGFDNALAGDIAYKRLLSAVDLGADVVVSACPSCKGSFNQAAARARKEKKVKMKVMDITELVASRL
ncbi:MAG TPA: FAD-linked oxidase C-terminal domain-containing protein [Desulfomonilaceae bacterium]|nr:FAD-linked oxidase C-terminal domain-containing protein [Desulfomonilaceae bacterium]